MIQKIFSNALFRVMSTWFAQYITSKFATERDNLISKLYDATSMMYLFHETNVQAISQYGIEGKTYVFGDTSTEDTSMDRPACAMYYIDEVTLSTVFVTTEEGEYIETQPNDQGEMFTCEYHDYITYLG